MNNLNPTDLRQRHPLHMCHGEALEARGLERRHLPEGRRSVHAQVLQHPQYHPQVGLGDGMGLDLVHERPAGGQHGGHVLPPLPPGLAREKVQPRLDPLAQCGWKLVLVAETGVRLPRIQQSVHLPRPGVIGATRQADAGFGRTCALRSSVLSTLATRSLSLGRPCTTVMRDSDRLIRLSSIAALASASVCCSLATFTLHRSRMKTSDVWYCSGVKRCSACSSARSVSLGPHATRHERNHLLRHQLHTPSPRVPFKVGARQHLKRRQTGQALHQ